jgi:exodeoxyribonuclease VII large subunit
MSRTPPPPFDPMKTAAMREARPAGVAGAPPLTQAAAGSAQQPLSISQANALLAHALAASLPAVFFVQGEISNFRTYDRGHAFFTLKDAGAELPCVMWKDALQRLKFRPKDGLAVIARGPVRLYEPQGRVQLYVETLLPRGAGELELAFRQLCEKLRQEGLFETARKRPLPRLPRHVAVITSRTGDVLHDVLTTAWRRYPGLRVTLYPVRVQGEHASVDMIRAINRLHVYQEELHARDEAIDLILLVRGGGSLEDLWAFNEEALARAIVAARIPIATGIGHEPDTTIADLVGDLRGPTPTGVTELTIPDVRTLAAELDSRALLLTRELRRQLALGTTQLDSTAVQLTAVESEFVRQRRRQVEDFARQIAGIEPRHAVAQGWRRVEEAQRRLEQAARQRLRRQADLLTGAAHRLERGSPALRIGRLHNGLQHLEERLQRALRMRLANTRQHLEAAERQLRVVSPQAVLDRGYSITTDEKGAILRQPDQVRRGDVIHTRLAEGEITSTVGKPRQSSLF